MNASGKENKIKIGLVTSGLYEKAMPEIISAFKQLDMGDPVRIVTLAENLIRLSGYTPYKDIDIVFTGLRPGEKLFEELLLDEEGMRRTPNKKIYIGNPVPVDNDTLLQALDVMRAAAAENNVVTILKTIKELVPTYRADKRTAAGAGAAKE